MHSHDSVAFPRFCMPSCQWHARSLDDAERVCPDCVSASVISRTQVYLVPSRFEIVCFLKESV